MKQYLVYPLSFVIGIGFALFLGFSLFDISQAQACPEVYIPVCGSDGKTYSNSCVAANAGATVASQGVCTGGASSVCGDGTQCAKGLSCRPSLLKIMCKPGGNCPSAYVCVPPATIADQICENGSVCPVGNKCVAVTPRCIRAEGCPANTYQCRPSTSTGICTREYAPVCGTDGKTYSNSCVATNAGTTVASRGACNNNMFTTDDLKRKLIQQFGTPYVCGSVDTESKSLERVTLTPKGDVYNFRISALKGALGWLNKVHVVRGLITKKAVVTVKSDSQTKSFCSIKKTEPKICTKEYDPVCGVDKKTYGNACEAEQKKAKVDYKGICKKIIGGDLDNNSCLVAAGYSWCASKNKCLRTFEEKCADVQILPVETGRMCPNGSVCGEGLVCKTNTDVQAVDCPAGARCFNPGQYSCVSPSLPDAAICGNGSVCAAHQTCIRDMVRLHCDADQPNCNVRYRCQNGPLYAL